MWSYDLTYTPLPPPLSSQQVVSLSQSFRLSLVRANCREEGGGGAKSYDREKTWSSIQHSILSAYTAPQSDNLFLPRYLSSMYSRRS
jgi:hypothetical protein